MGKYKRLFISFCVSLMAHDVVAETLERTVSDALQSNPDMALAIEQFNASREGVNIARGNFLPSIDLIADAGKEDINTRDLDTPHTPDPETSMNRKNVRLKLSLPLFRGFANTKEHQRAKLDMQANYYESLAQAERLSLKISKAYLDVLMAKEIIVMSLENLDHHTKTYDLVYERHTQGVADKADLSQVRGRMARARANLASAKNNLRDADTVFVQLVGLIPDGLIRPQIDKSYIPEDSSQALSLAMANNQTLRASQNSAAAATANAQAHNSHYYPKFDLVADKAWKDDMSGSAGSQDEWRILVEMNWNLYAGGRKSSEHKQAIYQQQSSRMRSNSAVREVKANVDSSWSAYKSLGEEIIYLQDYVMQTKETQKLYSQQFKVGRRTLLDLLDSQNELFQARKAYVAADYDYLYSQYRVISSMSYILDALNVNVMKGIQNEY